MMGQRWIADAVAKTTVEFGMERRTFGSLYANFLEPFSLLHGPYDGFHQFLNLLVQASHVGVFLLWLLVDLHGLDAAVIFCGQRIEHKVRVFVDADQVAGFEGEVIHETDEWEEDSLASGGLDDSGLADSSGVEIDVGAFFGSFLFHVEVEKLDDVSDQVR